MIKKIVPLGWPCSLEAAPPGPFVTTEDPDLLCFKSEYRHEDGRVMAFNSAGEYFVSHYATVQPVEMVLEEESL